MSTQYNGIPGNVTIPAGISISSSTNTSPIAVTTSSAHGMTTGDEAQITNHNTNTNANGRWVVIVTGPNTLTLSGSTGNGVGGASGFLYPLNLGATYSDPSDGDALVAASVDVALQTLGDRTALLCAQMSPYKLIALAQLPAVTLAFSSIGTTWATLTPSVTNTWQPFSYSSGSYILAIGNYLQAGDVVKFKLYANASWGDTTGGTKTAVSLFAATAAAGGSPGSATKCSAAALLNVAVTGASFEISGWNSVVLSGQVTVPSGAQQVVFYLYGATNDSTPGNTTLAAFGDYFGEIEVWRPTDFANRQA